MTSLTLQDTILDLVHCIHVTMSNESMTFQFPFGSLLVDNSKTYK